jgi:hypothetical protein
MDVRHQDQLFLESAHSTLIGAAAELGDAVPAFKAVENHRGD